MFSKYLAVSLFHFTTVAVVLKCLSLILPCALTGLFTDVGNFILFVIIATASFRLTVKKHLNERLQPENRAVLITGCDTGFGNLLAKCLDSQGFHVFASCLDESGPGANHLLKSCSKRLQVFQLDVTKDEDVKRALDFVKDNLGPSELWALVNNAGLYNSFGVEFTSMDAYKQNLEVNIMGSVRVTKAFLPLLRQSRGRIVNLTSIAGRTPAAHLSAYSVSKYAVAGFNDSLRQELEVWGIRVISVEPEMYRTGLIEWDTLSRRIDSSFEEIDEDVKSDYGKKYVEDMKCYIKKNLSLGSTKLMKVVNAIEDAVSLEHPEIAYRPCRNYFLECMFCIYEWMPYCAQDFALNTLKYVTGFPTPAEARNFS